MDSASTALLIARISYKATITAAIIPTLSGLIGTALGYYLNYYFDKKKRAEERHVDQMRVAFSKLLSLLIWYNSKSADKDELQNMKDAISNTELFGSQELTSKMYEALQLIVDNKWDKSRNIPKIDEIKKLMKKELKIK